MLADTLLLLLLLLVLPPHMPMAHLDAAAASGVAHVPSPKRISDPAHRSTVAR
jgi:hypothetical protein